MTKRKIAQFHAQLRKADKANNPSQTVKLSAPEAFDAALGSAAWYRQRAAEVRYNAEVVSQYNHFLGIAEAIERTESEKQPNNSSSAIRDENLN